MLTINPLISPNEVILLTSGENFELDSNKITLQIILTAQRRYIQPALGTDLYKAILNGEYKALLNNYIKHALALYIASSVIYNHTVRIGAGGVAIPVIDNHVKPSPEELSRVINTLRKNADTMLKIAIEYIVESKLFPEFSTSKSTSRVSTLGGVIIV